MTVEGLTKGGWKYSYRRANDSGFRTDSDRANPFVNGVLSITLARVTLPGQLEGLGSESRAFLETTKGRKISSAMWPGPNVEVNAAGMDGGTSTGIHGLYWPPLPGQTVALAFVDGCASGPIVLERYSTYVSHDPTLESMHILPVTQHQHSARDIVLGHYMGSYLAFRALTLPGQVDLFAQSIMQLQARVNVLITAPIISLAAPDSTSVVQPAVKGLDHATQIAYILAQIALLAQAVNDHTHAVLGGSTGTPSNSSDIENVKGAVEAIGATYSAAVLSPVVYHS